MAVNIAPLCRAATWHRHNRCAIERDAWEARPVTGQAVLEVVDVVKRYGERAPALDRVSLTLQPGEVCGLLGPNGAGKTTLVSIIAGLRSPDEWTVHVAGIDVATGGVEARRRVGLAAQETSVYPTVSVRQNLELFTRLAGYRGAAVAARIDEVSQVVELDHLLDRLARELSGGEKRRLHTAMALVHRPALLLLDEPTTGVDIGTRSRLLTAISALAAEEGCAVLYSTHYLPEVEELGASVAVLDRGQILARGPLDALVDEYGSGMVELSFDGPPPEIPGAVVDGDTARVVADRPAAAAAAIMAGLGSHAERLVSVELARPSLETVFVAVTGRTYRADDEDEPGNRGAGEGVVDPGSDDASSAAVNQ
jgi:ABC-2 type transport system ATP-binding protein